MATETRTSAHTYPAAALTADYARAAIGFALTGIFMVAADLSSPIMYILLPLALLFLVYGLRTALRQRVRVTVDGDGIAVSGLFGRHIPWSALRAVDLRYYSTKRDKSNGWMELRLTGPDGRIRLESTLNGFDTVVRRVAAAARYEGVALSPTSRTNMAAMGIRDAAADLADQGEGADQRADGGTPDDALQPDTGRGAAPGL
jgi:hypothetical protein